MSYICILGRQPALGAAELESIYGADAVSFVASDVIKVTTDHEPPFDNLGGTQKGAELLTTLDFTDWNKIGSYVQKNLPGLLAGLPEGKVTLGLSVHGINVPVPAINAAALSLKKVIKKSGRSARIVPNKEPSLNTAQVIHNKLTASNGIELMVIRSGNSTVLARTVWVQDIDAYRRRDQERPHRDARVGMLPPKLAQIILNLAIDHENLDSPSRLTVLDPFCGTGVILQESLLMGLSCVGSDLDPRMVEYSQKNMEWLLSHRDEVMRPRPGNTGLRNDLSAKAQTPSITEADATSHRWNPKPDLIACETYLGRALSSMPDQETLQKIIKDCDTIHRKFLQNITRQTEPGFRMCVAVPAWMTKNGFKHMPVLDHLEELGYNSVSFVHADSRDLVYHRENQIVARELVVLIRK